MEQDIKVTVSNSSLLAHNCGEIQNARPLVDTPLWRTLPKDLYDTDAGIMCWMANTHILPLHEVKHSQEVIDRLNEHGLYIYLYEPLCSYIEDDDRALGNGFNCGFYSEYPNNFSDWSRNRAAELDSISYYAYQNNLTNVIVRTGDYNVEKYYPHYSDQLNLECEDMFLRGLTIYDHINTEFKSKSELTTTFICTSWRYTPARHVIASILSKTSAHLTWFYKIQDHVLHNIQWLLSSDEDDIQTIQEYAEFRKQLIFGTDRLNNRAPMWLDKRTNDTTLVDDPMGHFYPRNVEGFADYGNPVSINPHTLPLEKYYRSSFIDIVCESRYAQPTANISEKVMQAIQFKTPFILVAPSYSLEYIKSLGYKTFDTWWDESYDTEENHLTRMKKIYDLIMYFENLTLDEKYQLYLDIQPVLQHNFDLHLSTTPDKGYRKYSAIKWDEISDNHWAADEIDPVTGRPAGWE